MVYSIDPSAILPLDKAFFQKNRSVAHSKFSDAREQTLRLRIPPGRYAVIPSTFNPGEEGSFLLRIFF